ncbi:hypothetical protein GUITHDRAFT_148508 [Guillardia theta CCMP2712]|uniref:PDZ domain-containing protein n=1 Tax=Guillardia theta (strain CCMP2712) TaxID=905079 RepID=L1I8J4_GUITC|nr:hypothetical protein GUITHDRAFT_148508 [Guillardia theta CCMP2712]EKX32591.1 hypothetical protein GUITHDRAFT_148508 [Guillardia theta CCMP2712]|eukprot:XP_005819571.1 hypothetical protein GUITHDRAFT_148508 [Guillardia theta CCMP2712]
MFEEGVREMANLQRRAEWMSEVCKEALRRTEGATRRAEEQVPEWNMVKGKVEHAVKQRYEDLVCFSNLSAIRPDWEAEMQEIGFLDRVRVMRNAERSDMVVRGGGQNLREEPQLKARHDAHGIPWKEEEEEDEEEFHASAGLSWMMEDGKVVITDIEPGSPAFFSPLAVGDHVLYVNDSRASREDMGILSRTFHDPSLLSRSERIVDWVMELRKPIQLVAQRSTQLVTASLYLAPVNIIWTLRATCTAIGRLRNVEEEMSTLEQRHLDAAKSALSETLRNLVAFRLKEWLVRGKLVDRLVSSFAKSVEKRANSMTAMLKASSMAEEQRCSQLRMNERANAICERALAKREGRRLRQSWNRIRRNVVTGRKLRRLAGRIVERLLMRSSLMWRTSAQEKKLSRELQEAKSKLSRHKYNLKALLSSFSWWKQVKKTKSLRLSLLHSLTCKAAVQLLSALLSTWRRQVKRIGKFRRIQFECWARPSLLEWKKFVKASQTCRRSTLHVTTQELLRLLTEINEVDTCVVRLSLDVRKQHGYIECLERSLEEAQNQLSASEDLQYKAGEKIRELEGELLRESLKQGSLHLHQ